MKKYSFLSYFFRAYKRIVDYICRAFPSVEKSISNSKLKDLKINNGVADNLRREVLQAYNKDEIIKMACLFSENKQLTFGNVWIDLERSCIFDHIGSYSWPLEDDYRKTNLRPEGINTDIKVPWESARLHNTLVLALGYQLTDEDKYLNSCINAILNFRNDFLPGTGPNWYYSMEVGIRLLNISLSVILLDDKLATHPRRKELLECIEEHVNHIVLNLEWRGGIRNNHYLVSLVGLYVGAYLLSKHKRYSLVASFAYKELFLESHYHFYESGEGAEHSSNYHRLNCESYLLLKALMGGWQNWSDIKYNFLDALELFISYPTVQPDIVFRFLGEKKYLEAKRRVLSGVRFLKLLQTSNYEYPLIGDNDSGRLVKILGLDCCYNDWTSWSNTFGLIGYSAQPTIPRDLKILDFRVSEGEYYFPNSTPKLYYSLKWNLLVIYSDYYKIFIQLGSAAPRIPGHSHDKVARLDINVGGKWLLRSGGVWSYNFFRSDYFEHKNSTNITLNKLSMDNLTWDLDEHEGGMLLTVYRDNCKPIITFKHLAGHKAKLIFNGKFEEKKNYVCRDYLCNSCDIFPAVNWLE